MELMHAGFQRIAHPVPSRPQAYRFSIFVAAMIAIGVFYVSKLYHYASHRGPTASREWRAAGFGLTALPPGRRGDSARGGWTMSDGRYLEFTGKQLHCSGGACRDMRVSGVLSGACPGKDTCADSNFTGLSALTCSDGAGACQNTRLLPILQSPNPPIFQSSKESRESREFKESRES